MTKDYLKAVTDVQAKAVARLHGELNTFCAKHDYRNANMPLGNAETALPRTGEKFYGKKD